MAALVIGPLPGAGYGVRLAARLRGLLSRRLLLRLAGIDTVMLEGRVYAVRAVPLGVARCLIPALIRSSRRFAAWQIDEALYDDLVQVLALGLGATPAAIERLAVPLWELGPVVEAIARVNGLPQMEAGGADLGKLLALMTKSTGTNSTPSSSAPPDGPGSTSTST
ncbi:MAG: hypothetical protein KKF85_03380 [Gammaproteobacteria bacterium]|nr:hypothetical protein [Rhodocyclaceae bacterium]MBU3908865.1 hypothetical protein [Gammaproteobacteria bacterium]MBU3987732.1 hypothetical protein [Gammaproteobacteria bacterium]MBU4003343.1 hypothetical protein [Gammaproteobacteria bacterium]MBU4021814.1 hypothetical protein [Gammaproteobacteria bacterium]